MLLVSLTLAVDLLQKYLKSSHMPKCSNYFKLISVISMEYKTIYTFLKKIIVFFFNSPPIAHPSDPLTSIFSAYLIACSSCHRLTVKHFYFIGFACTCLNCACSCVLCDVLSTVYFQHFISHRKKETILMLMLYIQARHNT